MVKVFESAQDLRKGNEPEYLIYSGSNRNKLLFKFNHMHGILAVGKIVKFQLLFQRKLLLLGHCDLDQFVYWVSVVPKKMAIVGVEWLLFSTVDWV